MSGAAENIVPMQRRRALGAGGNLNEHDRAVVQALAHGGIPEAARVLGTNEVLAERHVAELMHAADGRAFLARLLDARAVGVLAPLALTTVTELMKTAASDKTRLAAAQIALQVCGILGSSAGMSGAAKASDQAAQAEAAQGASYKGASTRELLARVEEMERELEGLPPEGGEVIDGEVTEVAPDDQLAPGGEGPPGGW
jgi:hypothetical protein